MVNFAFKKFWNLINNKKLQTNPWWKTDIKLNNHLKKVCLTSILPGRSEWGSSFGLKSATGLWSDWEKQICKLWKDRWCGCGNWCSCNIWRSHGVHMVNNISTRWGTGVWTQLGLPVVLTYTRKWLQLGEKREKISEKNEVSDNQTENRLQFSSGL